MAKENDSGENSTQARSRLAIGILIFSGISITVLAIVAIINNADQTITILNVVLPVFATWVGTIIAFYFGRENFESASIQVRKLVEQVTPDQRAKEIVTVIMRKLSDLDAFQIPTSKGDADINTADIVSMYNDKVRRLPILDDNNVPKYMIHQSSIDRYLAHGGQDSDTLEAFISSQKAQNIEYGLNKDLS